MLASPSGTPCSIVEFAGCGVPALHNQQTQQLSRAKLRKYYYSYKNLLKEIEAYHLLEVRELS